jgi:mannosylglucosylglycerate synthase
MAPISTSRLASHRIGFVSTRFEGTDGVSLETKKWVDVLEGMGQSCFFYAGACDWDGGRSMIVPEAHFYNPVIKSLNAQIFGQRTRTHELSMQVHTIKDFLKAHLYRFVKQFDLDLLITENALSIPVNIPLGMAITEFVAETGMPVIAHHHDFFWERKRFLVNGAWDWLNMSFPPHLPTIRHVVINSSGANQLSLRTGISNYIIPNVMDFDNPPAPPDEYCQDIRQALGVKPDEWFFLQPTRVVPRKGIEHAIELTRRLGEKARLVISHASGDEGYDYEQYLREYSQILGVPVTFEAAKIQDKRGCVQGQKIYTLFDLYPFADLVTYPSDIEGFGNAFLEALYFRRPIVVNNYSIYNTDIKPKGFRVIEFDGFITNQTVDATRELLDNPTLIEETAEHNYNLGRRHYSYTMLERRLSTILGDCFGEEY